MRVPGLLQSLSGARVLRFPSVRRKTQHSAAARPVLIAVAVGVCVALAGCGDSESSKPVANTSPQLPFPPQATEPITSRGGHGTPAGKVVQVGGRPEGIAIDAASGTLGVALRDTNAEFALRDTATLAPRTTVKLPGTSRHVWLAPGGKFLVPIEKTNQLAEVSPRGGTPKLIDVGVGPHAVTTAGDELYVADELGGTVTAIRDGKVRATFPVDVQPGGIVDVGRGKIAVVSVRAYTVELFDTKTLRGGGSQNAGYGPSHAVADAQGRIFIADTRGGNIIQYATRPRLKFISRLSLGGSPYGLALDHRRGTLWVTDTGRDRLYAISTSQTPRVVETYATVQQPNTVAVDERSGAAVVAGEAKGQLQLVPPPPS